MSTRYISLLLFTFIAHVTALCQFATVESGVNTDLTDICMINQSRGFITSNEGILLRTMDGGTSWSHDTIAGFDLMHVAFFDQVNGLITGANGSLLITRDGGISWSERTFRPNDRFAGLQITGINRAYVAGNGVDGPFILKSCDSGNTWERIVVGGRLRGNEIPYLRIFIQCISFLDDSSGLLGGYAINAHFDRVPFICRTRNSGSTLTDVTPRVRSCFSSLSVHSLHYLGPHDALALIPTPDGNVLFSSGYWLDRFDPVPVSRIPGKISASGMVPVDRLTSYIICNVDDRPQLLKTIDQGESFILLHPPSGYPLTEAWMMDPHHGIWVGTHGTILRMTDVNHAASLSHPPGNSPQTASALTPAGGKEVMANIFVYNVQVTDEDQISVSLFDQNNKLLSVTKSRTRISEYEFMVRLKLEGLNPGNLYYYVVLLNEQPLVDGSLIASL
ncbi:MAG: hypothetical protein JW861_08835 [Bacteroidales bacterium]|nr:hypothetical protein [Bacteroidales bacterium]